MPDIIADITKDQMDLNQGGSLFIQQLTLTPGGDPYVVILPVQAIQSIGVQSDDSPTYQVTGAPHSVIEAGNAIWSAWDGVSALNLCVTAVRVTPGAGAGTCYVTCRTFKN